MRTTENSLLTDVVIAALKRTCETDTYADAATYVPMFASAYADADDVAADARIYLGTVIESGLTGSLAAGAAVRRVCAWIGAERTAPNADPMRGAASIEANRETLETVAGDSHVAPDRIARWSFWDDLGAVWDALDDTGRAIMGTLTREECWTESGTPDARAILATLYPRCPIASTETLEGGAHAGHVHNSACSPTPPTLALVREALNQTRCDMREVGGMLADWRHAPSAAPDSERGLARDTRVPTSGVASAVVLTRPNGDRWVDRGDHFTRVTDDDAARILARTNLPAYVGGTARESDDAALAQTTPNPRRVPGVTVDRDGVARAAWGTAAVGSGTGRAAVRPVGSRKRKRDGGIGSPMIPA